MVAATALTYEMCKRSPDAHGVFRKVRFKTYRHICKKLLFYNNCYLYYNNLYF